MITSKVETSIQATSPLLGTGAGGAALRADRDLDLALKLLLAQRFAVETGVVVAGQLQPQSRTVDQRLGQGGELGLLGGGEGRAPGNKGLRGELLSSAPECGAEQSEGRGGRLGQEIANHAPDHAPDPELGVVETALDRNVDDDLALPVLE